MRLQQELLRKEENVEEYRKTCGITPISARKLLTEMNATDREGLCIRCWEHCPPNDVDSNQNAASIAKVRGIANAN
ncbi:unnamed protein product [Strongylus vulgaris]|uniref:Uncharacterized protein n=1 Tax=Strongylus vulgaris TaxID=40348 RepID=A0A3P7K1P5_STRVU|nr:unnamed protein product [Strongylus vulgaris]